MARSEQTVKIRGECFCRYSSKETGNGPSQRPAQGTKTMLLFSALIPHGKGKYLNQIVFFHKICQAPNLYLTLRVLPIEFNSQKY